jgi:hypothetical protein
MNDKYAFGDALSAYAKFLVDDHAMRWNAMGGRPDAANHWGIELKRGPKYVRVMTVSNGQRSAHSFIVREDGDKFKQGDILLAKSWKGPATNKARGNIMTAEYAGVTCYGAGYL